VLGSRLYLAVLANLEPALMEGFERWYWETHLPHVIEIPGIVRAHRSDWSRGSANRTAPLRIR